MFGDAFATRLMAKSLIQRIACCLLPAALLLFILTQKALAQNDIERANLTENMIETTKHPDEMTLYSLKAEHTNSEPRFKGWKVLGQTPLTDKKEQAKIAESLRTCITRRSDNQCPFQPHHGIRFVKGDRQLDFVICFHCHHLLAFNNGKLWKRERLNGKESELEDKLNSVLIANKITQEDEYLNEISNSEMAPSEKPAAFGPRTWVRRLLPIFMVVFFIAAIVFLSRQARPSPGSA